MIGTKKKLVNPTEDGPKKFVKLWPNTGYRLDSEKENAGQFQVHHKTLIEIPFSLLSQPWLFWQISSNSVIFVFFCFFAYSEIPRKFDYLEGTPPGTTCVSNKKLAMIREISR